MTRRSAFRATAVAIALATLVGVGTAVPSPASATASWRKVSSSVVSFNGGGAYVSAEIRFLGKRNFERRNLYVNDRCNAAGHGDGLSGSLHVLIRARNRDRPVLAAVTSDHGGCRSAPVRQIPVGTYRNGLVDDYLAIAFQACAGKVCAKPTWIDNPYT